MNENVEVVRRGYEAYARHDVAAVMALVDRDIEVVQTELLPWGGVHLGLEGAQTFFRLLAKHTDAMPEPAACIPAGNDVAVVGKLRGTARG